MAALVRRGDSWSVVWREGGRQKWRSFGTDVTAAENFRLSRVEPRSPATDTLKRYGERWLVTREGTLAPGTLAGYRTALRKHVFPALGDRPLSSVSRGDLSEVLSKIRRSDETVRRIHATLGVMFAWAVDDGAITANPAIGLRKKLGIGRSKRRAREEVRPLDDRELARLLAAARVHSKRLAPLIHFLAKSGLRLGEALALRWSDVDFKRHTIRVERSVSYLDGSLRPPKSGHGRDVDLSPQLEARLRALERAGRVARGVNEGNLDLVFPARSGGHRLHGSVDRRFRRLCELAGIRPHTPHDLRHTYAANALTNGCDPTWLQLQLGHASYQLTVDLYGKWRQPTNRAMAKRLDVSRSARSR